MQNHLHACRRVQCETEDSHCDAGKNQQCSESPEQAKYCKFCVLSCRDCGIPEIE